METINKTVKTGTIQGTCDPRFMPVAEAFEHNFQENNEIGASVCLTLEGETVVDLWGGTANQEKQTPWEEDTLCTVFSCTKGAVALAAHTLVNRGELEVDALVKKYWPEFAKNGKESATVKMMFDHSVGLPALRDEVKAGGCCDWDYMIERMENEEPFWKPGIRNGYHMINFGWTVGELVKRVAGQSLGSYFQEAIAQPTGADFWIGLPEEHESRVAPIMPFVPGPDTVLGAFPQAIMTDPKSIQALSLLNSGGFDPNSRDCHAAEIGGGGGISNARGLAKIYAPFACGGSLNGKEFVDADTLSRMGEVSMATNEDATLLIPSRFALGFMKSIDNRRRESVDKDSVVLSSAAFGHVGAGGSIGFADPDVGFSMGYAMNRMGQGILLNERGQSLVDAAYQSLGFSGNQSGVWRR